MILTTTKELIKKYGTRLKANNMSDAELKEFLLAFKAKGDRRKQQFNDDNYTQTELFQDFTNNFATKLTNQELYQLTLKLVAVEGIGREANGATLSKSLLHLLATLYGMKIQVFPYFRMLFSLVYVDYRKVPEDIQKQNVYIDQSLASLTAEHQEAFFEKLNIPDIILSIYTRTLSQFKSLVQPGDKPTKSIGSNFFFSFITPLLKTCFTTDEEYLVQRLCGRLQDNEAAMISLGKKIQKYDDTKAIDFNNSEASRLSLVVENIFRDLPIIIGNFPKPPKPTGIFALLPSQIKSPLKDKGSQKILDFLKNVESLTDKFEEESNRNIKLELDNLIKDFAALKSDQKLSEALKSSETDLPKNEIAPISPKLATYRPQQLQLMLDTIDEILREAPNFVFKKTAAPESATPTASPTPTVSVHSSFSLYKPVRSSDKNNKDNDKNDLPSVKTPAINRALFGGDD